MAASIKMHIICFVIAMLFANGDVNAQEIVNPSTEDDSGTVVGYVNSSNGEDHFMYRGKPYRPIHGDFETGLLIEEEDDKPPVWINDKFSAPESGKITLILPDVDTSIEMEDATLKIAGTKEKLICDLLDGEAKFNGKSRRELEEDEEQVGCCIRTNKKEACTGGTEFLVRANGYQSSLFVIEGKVQITSDNPEHSQRWVREGEWVQFRRDGPIPPPQRYRLSDARSGSTDCIYSNCKLSELVLIPAPPFITPQILFPPPFNPPGRK